MLCNKCGKNIPDNSKFCCWCGSQADIHAEKKMICPNCNTEHSGGVVYCKNCGYKLISLVPNPPAKELISFITTYFEGEPVVSIGGLMGKLKIYGNKLFFKAIAGGIRQGGLFAFGRTIEIPIKNIKTAREGRYAGITSTLVIEEKGGRIHTFANAVPGTSTVINRAVSMVNNFINGSVM